AQVFRRCEIRLQLQVQLLAILAIARQQFFDQLAVQEAFALRDRRGAQEMIETPAQHFQVADRIATQALQVLLLARIENLGVERGLQEARLNQLQVRDQLRRFDRSGQQHCGK